MWSSMAGSGQPYLTQVGTDRSQASLAPIFPSQEHPSLPLPTQNHHLKP